MTQPLFPSTISTQSRSTKFLTIKTVVRKIHQNDGQTSAWCLDKAVLAQGGGGGTQTCFLGASPPPPRGIGHGRH